MITYEEEIDYFVEFINFTENYSGFRRITLDPNPIVWIGIIIIIFLIYLVTLLVKKKIKPEKVLIHLSFIIYCVSVFRLVFTPIEIFNLEYLYYYSRAFHEREPFTLLEHIRNIDLIPFRSIYFTLSTSSHTLTMRLRPVIGNFVLLLPLPILLNLFRTKKMGWKKLMLIVFLTTVSIETTQLIINIVTNFPSRLVLIDDVILNTLGGAVGCFIIIKYGDRIEKLYRKMIDFSQY